MLPRQPLRFLLADDPGAGKTIMAGLLIKELIARGDLQRCLIVCPGSLAEQWQDELYRRFSLPFDILTNDKLEAARTGNWFLETNLGRVDGFENDQAECECDERPEVPVGLLAAERDALEALELSHELLDAGARPVERLREEGRPLLGRGLHGDNRADASLAGRGPVGLGIIAFVAHRGAGRDIRPEVEQDLELAAVARLTRGQVEGERQAVEIDLDVDLGREAPARAAEGLARGPPFSPSRRAPAAET